VYKGKLNLFNKYSQKEFIKKIEYLKHLYPEFIIKQSEKNPGQQYPIFTTYDELNYIYDNVRNVNLPEFKNTNDCIIKSWVYISDNKNVYAGYHDHENLALISDTHTPLLFNTTFTFTYYLQMPDNLNNDDGYLYFKTKDNVEYGFLPKEDEVWIFPPNLLHQAKNNPSSNKKRIVIASNIHFFDYKSAKLDKTLF
jgi:hypothetical protein